MKPHDHRRLIPLLSVLVLACSPKLSGDLSSLDGRTFLSERVSEDGTPRDLVAGSRLLLRFHEATSDTSDTSGTGDTASTGDSSDMPDTWVGAYTGCNWWSGLYTIEDDALVVTEGDHTLIGCDWLDQQEHRYFTFLESGPSLALDGHALVLEDGGKRIEYLDEATATPDLELAGNTWVVDSILESYDVVLLRPPQPATLVFETDENLHPDYARGTMTFYTGCNTGSGTYFADEGRSLRFYDLTLTHNVCDGDAARLESLVLRVLDDESVGWEVAVDQLRLAGEGVTLALVANHD